MICRERKGGREGGREGETEMKNLFFVFFFFFLFFYRERERGWTAEICKSRRGAAGDDFYLL
jgi:hypothetical protein